MVIDWNALLAFVTGSLFTAIVSYANNSLAERKRRRRQLDGVLAAISAELKALGTLYDQTSGKFLQECIEKGENIYPHKFHLQRDYFIVFPGNTGVVGQVEDPALAESIVSTYIAGNALIEQFEINNVLLDRGSELIQAAKAANNPGGQQQLQQHGALLEAHCKVLKAAHTGLDRMTKELLLKIGLYRQKHQ